MSDIDTRPRYGHNLHRPYLWTKITHVAHGKGYVMARRPHCDPFVVTVQHWLTFPIWDDQPNKRDKR